jgi:hypothetical protein
VVEGPVSGNSHRVTAHLPHAQCKLDDSVREQGFCGRVSTRKLAQKRDKHDPFTLFLSALTRSECAALFRSALFVASEMSAFS